MLLLSLAIFTVGFSKDAEVNAFIGELDGTTQEIVAKIDANPTSAGIDEAQKAFDARRPQLTAKWDEIKTAVGAQVSKDSKQNLEESVRRNMKALTEVSMRNMMKMTADKQASDKFRRLVEDYAKTFAVSS